MSEPKFSPGEWKVERIWSNGYEVCPRIWVETPDGREWVAEVTGAPQLGFKSTLPNARLIAASPDLFAFVRDYADNSVCSCDDWMTNKPGEPCKHCRAVRLIEKATGTT